MRSDSEIVSFSNIFSISESNSSASAVRSLIMRLDSARADRERRSFSFFSFSRSSSSALIFSSHSAFKRLLSFRVSSARIRLVSALRTMFSNFCAPSERLCSASSRISSFSPRRREIASALLDPGKPILITYSGRRVSESNSIQAFSIPSVAKANSFRAE